jgi:hypothetical protein
MNCRVCGSSDASSIAVPGAAGGPWFRCLNCGSDSSAKTWPEVRGQYAGDYMARKLADEPTKERQANFYSNVEWFQHYMHHAPGRDFLDVGFGDDVMMRQMEARGWSIHGFDIVPEWKLGAHTTIFPFFQAFIFPQKYSALHVCEVLEHVPGWRQFLVECHAALAMNGLLIVQTPRPWQRGDDNPAYQVEHLQLFSPASLERHWWELGFRILDRRFWKAGQAWLLQKKDGV